MSQTESPTPGSDRFANSSLPDLAGGKADDDRPVVMPCDEASFGEVVARSNEVPVVLVLTAPASQPSQQLAELVERLVKAHQGRLVMATVDLTANPGIAQALQVQAVPTAVALVKGQPVPLFQGLPTEEQITDVLAELLTMASKAGVTGQVTDGGEVEVPLPPLHQSGFDALERGDMAAARQAFSQALAQSPADQAAKAALAQIDLLERLAAPDLADAVARAEDGSGSLEDEMAAADALLGQGQGEAAYERLLARLPLASPEDRETIRLRLLELFEVAGPDDPAVAKGRRQLAAALF
ncbi:MAG: tetratricopeptide repeat protein [Micrococcales bacterium]|nr:tetratricopeptide repeat protein [Micrococcales bacterium]